MEIKCVIVDDEPLAHDVLKQYIGDQGQMELVASFTDPAEALNYLSTTEVDLLFLDVDMPKFSGLELLRSLRQRPVTILTSAHKEYAVEGFELQVADFLLKPFSYARFAQAIGKIQSRELTESPEKAKYFFIKADKKMVKVAHDEVRYLESLKDYIKLYTDQGLVISHQKIGHMEEVLPDDRYVRIHRSYIIPLHSIQSFNQNTVEACEKEFPIGRNYKEQVLTRLQKWQQIN